MDKIDILYEDNHVLVAVKPAFMLSQADRSGKPDMLSALSSMIKVRDKKQGNVFLGLVHRLDQPVSGVMLFAKTSKAAGRLAEQFRTRAVEKFYLAVVHGRLPDGISCWQDYLSTKTKNGRYYVTDAANGRHAALFIRKLGEAEQPDRSLVHISLLTGRSHQIRLQSNVRGFPLIGDRRYGPESESDKKTPSIALFAERLIFEHPTRRERIEVSAEPELPVFQAFSAVSDNGLLSHSAHLLAEAAAKYSC